MKTEILVRNARSAAVVASVHSSCVGPTCPQPCHFSIVTEAKREAMFKSLVDQTQWAISEVCRNTGSVAQECLGKEAAFTIDKKRRPDNRDKGAQGENVHECIV